jgi:hypothetical protein
MRGELIGVWSETWREIWAPLIDQESSPDDIFCQLYRELAAALKEPSADDAIALAINDAIQMREAFDRAVVLAGIEVDLARLDEVFDDSLAATFENAISRRGALETALLTIINDPTKSVAVLSQALSELSNDPQKRGEARERALEGVINDKTKSRDVFERTQAGDFAGERAIVTFLEAAHEILDDLGGDVLTNLYFNLLTVFIDKYSLRYDLRRPCMLCPTLPGVFSSLVRDLREVTSQDAHLDSLMKEFENAIRDLRTDCSDGRIKTCIQKQVNLLEAIGRMFPGVTGTTLGAICDQVGTWPHDKLKVAIKDLYGFACDYPGIRHGGTPANALRAIEMRDMIAISILLAGFTPYLTDQLNADSMYRGR